MSIGLLYSNRGYKGYVSESLLPMLVFILIICSTQARGGILLCVEQTVYCGDAFLSRSLSKSELELLLQMEIDCTAAGICFRKFFSGKKCQGYLLHFVVCVLSNEAQNKSIIVHTENFTSEKVKLSN